MTKLSISHRGAPDAVVEDDNDAELKQAGAAVVIEDDESGDAPKGKLPARAILNDDGSVTLPLAKKVTLTIRKGEQERSETYSDLVFHELSGLDMRLAEQEKDPLKAVIVTLARSTRMTSVRMNVLFDRLSQRDIKGATDIIKYFQE